MSFILPINPKGTASVVNWVDEYQYRFGKVEQETDVDHLWDIINQQAELIRKYEVDNR